MITVVDPSLVVLGGGIGQATGFAEAVAEALERLAPVQKPVKVSALGTDAVVDGCLAEGAALAWNGLTAALVPASALPARRRGVTARKHNLTSAKQLVARIPIRCNSGFIFGRN